MKRLADVLPEPNVVCVWRLRPSIIRRKHAPRTPLDTL